MNNKQLGILVYTALAIATSWLLFTWLIEPAPSQKLYKGWDKRRDAEIDCQVLGWQSADVKSTGEAYCTKNVWDDSTARSYHKEIKSINEIR